MATGKKQTSPIVQAILQMEKITNAEIRVHVSQRWLERDPYLRATRLFQQYSLWRTTDRNAVLFYLNLRHKKYAILGDKGIAQAVGKTYWDELGSFLAQDLRSTYWEKAVALAIQTIGVTLSKHFPSNL